MTTNENAQAVPVQPSAGAVRAAEAIGNYEDGLLNPALTAKGNLSVWGREVASIIDAESGLGEAREALKNILADCERAQEVRTAAEFDFATFHAVEYAQEALARIEGSQP
jgi:hypothetical protein